ncbi:hypothetical protein GIB67_030300 [Kingdonia uniflora]|uniref:Cytochrome P450 n=1 Tax=Kingdonia uniflora TaxID=39325 RepID=A0A7J7M6J2_9MAGN|nr:hypothetical protein GIB67_030300 [Kingdonia uniflora]
MGTTHNRELTSLVKWPTTSCTLRCSKNTWTPYAPTIRRGFYHIVSSPEMAKEVMKTHDLVLADRFELIVGKIMFYNCTNIASTPYGDYWRQLWKICFLELLSAKHVQSFRSVREEEVSKLIRSISMSTTGPELKAINLSKKLFSMMNDITSRAAFGEKCKDKDIFLSSMHEALKLASSFDVDLFP